MPTINKIEKQKKSSEKKETDMRKLRAEGYNSTAWKKLRDTYYKSHPICEKCLEKGVITPAEDIHHIRSPFRNGVINYGLLLDPDNLMAVCKKCHQEIHNKKGLSPEEIIRQLDLLFDDAIPDSEFEDDNQ